MAEAANLERPEYLVTIPADGVRLEGILGLPADARGIVLFAHGSGSGRHSPRNNFVARVLQQSGLATLLLDLLAEQEADDQRNVFDIDLLADRLLRATEWLQHEPRTRELRVGYFGASTGAGAALQAAARSAGAGDPGDRPPSPAAARPKALLPRLPVCAVVSRGGRPDLADTYLAQVQAPTLLIVGGHDVPVIRLNEYALAQLRCPKELVIVPGATHLFEEPGALEEVARLARDWFQRYLGVAP